VSEGLAVSPIVLIRTAGPLCERYPGLKALYPHTCEPLRPCRSSADQAHSSLRGPTAAVPPGSAAEPSPAVAPRRRAGARRISGRSRGPSALVIVRRPRSRCCRCAAPIRWHLLPGRLHLGKPSQRGRMEACRRASCDCFKDSCRRAAAKRAGSSRGFTAPFQPESRRPIAKRNPAHSPFPIPIPPASPGRPRLQLLHWSARPLPVGRSSYSEGLEVLVQAQPDQNQRWRCCELGVEAELDRGCDRDRGGGPWARCRCLASNGATGT